MLSRIVLATLGLIALFAPPVFLFFYGSSGFFNKDRYSQIVSYAGGNLTDSDTIRIMSYNIGYMSGMTNNTNQLRTVSLFENNLTSSKELIDRYHPHIIGFQEIDFDADRSFNVDQLSELSSSLGYQNAQLSVNWDKRYVPFPYWPISSHFAKVLSGQAIVSTFEIASSERVVLEPPESANFLYFAFYIDRILQVSELALGASKIYVLNVHLEAYDQTTRIKQAKVVSDYYNKYSSDYPTFLIGDFNAEPLSLAEDDSTFSIIMNSKNIAHAFDRHKFELDPLPFSTYSSARPLSKIDYIFYTPNFIDRIKLEVLNEAKTISDHLPILFTCKLRQTKRYQFER